MHDVVKKAFQHPGAFRPGSVEGSVEVAARAELTGAPHWAAAFSNQRKDLRYYELVEDTICPDFVFRYFVIKNGTGAIAAVQPFFILDQDVLAGIRSGRLRAAISFMRRLWPRFMRLRTLMVGCAAGEGHLDGADEVSRRLHARLLAEAILQHARAAKASLIVLKEFPAEYRAALECFLQRGFTRVPSLPMVRLSLNYSDFDDYMNRGISRRMRANLRRNFRASEEAAPIEMSVMHDATPVIDELYPLYLQVYERSTLRFETLTRDYFCRIGRVMPDKVRFFVWRQCGKIVAFSLCTVQDDTICTEYVGFDYDVALDLHLYFYAFRDTMNWAIANGYKRCLGSSLSYDPKWHLRFLLHPLDLYVRHTARLPNLALKWLLPLVEPTRYDRTLPRFANYAELWDSDSSEPWPASVAEWERR